MVKSEERYGPRFQWRDEIMEMRATAFWELGKWDEADKLLDQHFKGRAKLLEMLAKDAFVHGMKSSSERILSKQFDGKEEIMESFAKSYIREENWSEAKPILLTLLQNETDQSARLQRMHTLANVCFAQKEYGEAESWCLKAVMGSQSPIEEGNRLFYQAVNLLAQIYNAEGDHMQAASYEAVLADLSPGLHGINS